MRVWIPVFNILRRKDCEDEWDGNVDGEEMNG